MNYLNKQSGGHLEITGADQDNGFAHLLQGAWVPKSSGLTQAVLGSFAELQKAGTLSAIMNKWNLGPEILTPTGLNLAAQYQ